MPRAGNAYAWLPNDQNPRTDLDISNLDLKTNYLEFLEDSSTEKPKPQTPKREWKRWYKETPLEDPKLLPDGWHMNEPDLEIGDIEGQIQRCHERLEENIMPAIFRQRLIEYENSRDENMKISEAAPAGISFKGAQRLRTLKMLLIDIKKGEGLHHQLRNIQELIKAYSHRRLDWRDGIVTYWSNGHQLCQPRPFDWDEQDAMSRHHRQSHNSDGGFWVEGTFAETRPSLTAAFMTFTSLPIGNSMRPNWNIALRAPGFPFFAELNFLFDTGCPMMMIYNADLATIFGGFGPPLYQTPVSGGIFYGSGVSGTTFAAPVIYLEVTIINNDVQRRRLTPWTRIPIYVNPGAWSPTGRPRLDGSHIRSLLYCAMAPGQQNLYTATTRHSLTTALPNIFLNHGNVQAPEPDYTDTSQGVGTPFGIPPGPALPIRSVMPLPARGVD